MRKNYFQVWESFATAYLLTHRFLQGEKVREKLHDALRLLFQGGLAAPYKEKLDSTYKLLLLMTQKIPKDAEEKKFHRILIQDQWYLAQALLRKYSDFPLCYYTFSLAHRSSIAHDSDYQFYLAEFMELIALDGLIDESAKEDLLETCMILKKHSDSHEEWEDCAARIGLPADDLITLIDLSLISDQIEEYQVLETLPVEQTPSQSLAAPRLTLSHMRGTGMIMNFHLALIKEAMSRGNLSSELLNGRIIISDE